MPEVAHHKVLRRLLGGLPLALALAGALALLTLSRDSVQATFNVADPVPGQVATVAADMDVTGNGPTALGGPVDTSIGGIAVNATHDIDIVLDEIDVVDSLAGFGLNLLYDSTIINITAKDFSFNLTGGIDFASEPLPDSDGDLRLDVANFLPTAGLSGELILIRITLKCVASGTSFIDVDDVFGGDGIPDIFNVTGTELSVGSSQDGTITCGDADGDGVPDSEDNCPAWPNAGQALPPWPVPADDPDCDGWPSSVAASGKGPESSIGTDPDDPCADTITANDERGPAFSEPLSPQPPDFNDDTFVDITDVSLAGPPVFNISQGKGDNPDYDERFDLNADDFVDITDVSLMGPPFFNISVPCPS